MIKTALVTGTARGFGQCIAADLADRGMRIIGLQRGADRKKPDWLDESIAVDLSSTESDIKLAQALDRIAVDVLVNNAGVFLDNPRQQGGNFLDHSIDTMRETFQVNFFAAARLTQLVLPSMIKRGYGRIVNVSSGMARLTDHDGDAVSYRASKLSLNALTLAIARTPSRPEDLACFSFCPGWIKTDMGTDAAPNLPEPVAAKLGTLIEAPAEVTNGRFFRGAQELDWHEKEFKR